MAKIKLQYCLKNTEITHISKVDSGHSLDHLCPSCGHTLVAKKGSKTTHHFAHYNSSECAHAVETALHLAAKTILSEKKIFTVPPVFIEFESNKKQITIWPEQTIEFDQVIEERKIQDIVPDIIAKKGGRELLIEVKVTHGVDEVKLEKIKELGISVLEIDLSKIERDFTEESLEKEVISNVSNKVWLYNSRVRKIKEGFLNLTEDKAGVPKGNLEWYVIPCPIGRRDWKGQPSANVKFECLYCEHCFGYENYIIKCAGRHRISTYQDLQKYHRKLKNGTAS